MARAVKLKAVSSRGRSTILHVSCPAFKCLLSRSWSPLELWRTINPKNTQKQSKVSEKYKVPHLHDIVFFVINYETPNFCNVGGCCGQIGSCLARVRPSSV